MKITGNKPISVWEGESNNPPTPVRVPEDELVERAIREADAKLSWQPAKHQIDFAKDAIRIARADDARRIGDLEARIAATNSVIWNGYPNVGGDNVRCEHGGLASEECIACYNVHLLAALNNGGGRGE